MAMRKNQESWCMCDNRLLPANSFYKSSNPHHTGGLLPYCKKCCQDIFAYYLKKVGGIRAALYFTCAEVGVPFVQEVYRGLEEMLEKKKTSNYFGNYLRILYSLKGNLVDRKNFSDTDVALGDVISIEDYRRQVEEDVQQFKLDWGDFPDIEDYQFLEYRYDVYTEGMTKLKPAQETLYRKLCIAELESRKIEKSGGSTKDIQKQILDLMSRLRIDNFAEVKDKDLTEQLIESQIALHEKQMPMEYYDDKQLYADACGLGEGWDEIKRCMINFPFSRKEYPRIKKDGVDDG